MFRIIIPNALVMATTASEADRNWFFFSGLKERLDFTGL